MNSPHPLPRIVAFDDELPEAVDTRGLLGGKGAGLVEMSRDLQLQVPPGFVITTEVCRQYLQDGWPPWLDAALDTHLDALGRSVGARLGDPDAPLLVSIRSGAPVSMPGMMDTLLNVGIRPEVRRGLAAQSGDAAFAADTWLRFSLMYAQVILDVHGPELVKASQNDGSEAGLLSAAARVGALVEEAAGRPIETNPREQVKAGVEAVFRSWNSDRARTFRAHEGISERLGTAAIIQAMVFGNRGANSGTGVVFTRDPATGESRLFGDYLPGGQGEDVVAGTHEVGNLDLLRESQPEVFQELVTALEALEHYYGDMCDVEFTVSEGQLFFLQTRVGRRTPLAAIRIAVAMAEDPSFPLTRAEAVQRVDPAIRELAAGRVVRAGSVPLATGLAASPGVGTGVLCCDPRRAAELHAQRISFVLARETTAPADVDGIVGASGLMTKLGGVASHAAVVARSWGVPAVTGVPDLELLPSGGVRLGGTLVAEGEVLTVDGSSGAIYSGDQREDAESELPELLTLQAWATEPTIEPEATLLPKGPEGAPAPTLVELARTLDLKGVCSPERAAATLGAHIAAVSALLSEFAELFRETPRGLALSATGVEWLAAELANERAGTDGEALHAAYARFAVLDKRFKRAVTGWQRKLPQRQTTAEWARVLDQVRSVNEGLQPLLEKVVHVVPRLGRFGRRLEEALNRMAAGDRTMLASPAQDSYHTIWFELHEELLGLCGLERSG